MSDAVTPETPAPATVPTVTPERLSTLKHLCLARCGGDRRLAKPLYKTMRGMLASLQSDTQDDLLATLAADLEELQRTHEVPDSTTEADRVSATSASDSAAEANRVLASILGQKACAGLPDVVASGPVIEAGTVPAPAVTTPASQP